VEDAYRESRGFTVPPVLAVGFNRRFAPHVLTLKQLLGRQSEPKCFVMTVNAGRLPAAHWLNDPAEGGGRILGEACHFIDLLRHLAEHPISEARISGLGGPAETATINLAFADGSIGTIHYIANGAHSYPKETLEVFCAGSVVRLENFRRLRAFGWKGVRPQRLWRQDKGQHACAVAFIEAIRGKTEPVPFNEILEVSRLAIELSDALRG
jgi:predicted dehydrogenase